MGPSLLRAITLVVPKSFDFVEFQAHDNMKARIREIPTLNLADMLGGDVTLHGEGETDGKRKIAFCSCDKAARKNYVRESINLYSDILSKVGRVERIILHPDTLTRKYERFKQLEFLAESLSELSDAIDKKVTICIEPRGGDKQGKVLRNKIQDIKILQQTFELLGTKRIGLCIDAAQLYIVHGKDGIAKFLTDLKSIDLSINEFHISDVLRTENVENRVAVEIGKGSIDWQYILPIMLPYCNNFLIETFGGKGVFQRSMQHLEYLIKKK